MTDYIKIPTFPTQDLLLGVEATSPSPRVKSQQSRPEGYSRHPHDTAEEKNSRDPRRFVALRRLIEELQVSAQIDNVDFATADAELHHLGLAIVEEELIPQLLQLKIPLESIEQLLQQVDNSSSSFRRVGGRRIYSTEPALFPVSTEGMSEYSLRIEGLKINSGEFGVKLIDEIDREGLCIEQRNRLCLIFSRDGSAAGTVNKPLKLRISVLLGVMESDEAGRRAILYPRGDKSYGLYADKLINLSI